MRTFVEQREELAVDVEHADVAALDADQLLAADRDFPDLGHHMPRCCHQGRPNSALALVLKIFSRSSRDSLHLKAKAGSSKSQCG